MNAYGANDNDTVTPPQYRFDFGKNKGKTLDECDPGYIKWLIKEDVAANKPELKAALAQHNSRKPQSAPKYIASRAPSTPTRNANAQPASSKVSIPEVSSLDYIFTFGKHNGSRLRDVPDQYLRWLATNIKDFTSVPELKTAFQALGIGTEQISGGPRPDWKPPSLSNIPYPQRDRFVEYITGETLWISDGDARKFFGLQLPYLIVLPRVSSTGRARYWLHHVWDMVKVHQSRPSADAALRSFLMKNQDVTEDIWASMGLGVDLD
jgi:uncharacterized protein (DUF3820 family)